MNYSIFHPTGIINGEINLPRSKSLSNRALIIHALNNKKFEIEHLSLSNDTIVLQRALNSKEKLINIEDAGTAMRFLTSYFSIQKSETILTGSDQMKKRPIGELVDSLRHLGADIEYLEKENYPPIKIIGKELNGGEININSEVSSQFISSLLMIAPLLKNGIKINLQNDIVSKPYILMTLKMLNYFGIEYLFKDNSINISNQPYQLKNIKIENDWSAVAFWLEMVSLSKKARIILKGLNKNSWQGDSFSPNFFKDLGVLSYFEDSNFILEKKQNSEPAKKNIHLIDYPDLSLALINTYAFKKITANFTGLSTLKRKESDRLTSLQTELKKCGINAKIDSDSFSINAVNITNITPSFSTYKDHRIAMCLAPLALQKTVVVEDVEVVKKSYPNYWEDLKKVGFTITPLTH